MFKNFLTQLAGNPYERELQHYTQIVEQVAGLEPEMQARSDAELRELTGIFRQRIQEHVAGIEDEEEYRTAEREIMDAILPEAFAAVREAAIRTIGQRHFDVQIIGGVVLHEGKIAEMRTGEGKTLVATLPLYLNALAGRGAHLVTVNDYLARRDGGWMGPIFHLLGLTVGVIGRERYSAIYDPAYVDPGGDLEDERLVHWRPTLRRECYRADVTYGTASEFGFDYLRDNTATEMARTVQREHVFAIVDEVDSVLIDGARTPLIISGPAAQASSAYQRFAQIIEQARLRRNTSDLEVEEPNGDYILDDRTQSVSLTDQGIEKVERQLEEIDTAAGQSVYDPQYYELVHYLENALKARYIFHRDKDYIVQNGRVILIDQTTGRPMPSRRYSEGLHQAIEAKEGVRIRREDVTIATITVQNYFRLYEKLSGMTGTALTQAEEFDEVYELDVDAIPTNVEFRAQNGEFNTREDKEEGVPVVTYWEPDNLDQEEPSFYRRIDYPDQVYVSIDGKFDAVAREISHLATGGRPVLVGTGSVEASEVLSGRLKAMQLEHAVLNAKNHDKEALIVAQAGRPGAITISTSMAGRGTDILLGGNPEGLANSLIAEKCFRPASFAQVVADVVRGDLNAAREKAASDPYMGEAVVGWAEQARKDLARKAEVEDVLRQVVEEVRQDATYAGIPFDTLLTIARQIDLAAIDQKRYDKAREQVEEMGVSLSLIPEIQYRLHEYRSLGGLMGDNALVETLANRLFEQHYNARAALVRAVLSDDLDEAHDIIERIPALPASLIDDIQAVRKQCALDRQHIWDEGGLHVIGTERHESRRIDDQLRGRAARQGDPGSSRFYLSLEDELMIRFGGERAKRMMERLNVPEDIPIAANILSNVIEQAQARFESYYFDIRKSLVEYDEAVNRQRQIVYDERRAILEGDRDELDAMTLRFIEQTIERQIARLTDEYEAWALEEIENTLTDFSNIETGEVNTRGAVQRLLPLFPRPSEEELQDLLNITEGDELFEALHELVLDGIDAGYNLRMLHAEIARIVPLWPVLPPVGPKGAEGWDGFVERARATFERYGAEVEVLADQWAAIWEDTEAGLAQAARDLVVSLGKGVRPNEAQSQFYGQINTVLGEAFQAIMVQLQPEELIEVLLERVDELLAVARRTPGDGDGDGSGATSALEQQVFSIGAEDLTNYQRALMLNAIDTEWRQYLMAIDDLRTGVGLEAYGQRDPKVAFKLRASEMFDQLRGDVQEGIARRFFGELPRYRQVIEQQKQQDELLDRLAQSGYRVERRVSRAKKGSQQRVSQTVRKDMWSKVGRNDPCPCGSGKKFKDCHYREIQKQQQTVSQDAIVRGRSSRKGKRR